MIAALYVERDGAYFGLPNVDPWDKERDARKYSGPHPVIAHPPCERWCQLAPVNQARYGLKIGDDDGCFAAALAAVRKFGGILEHPAYSLAWKEFDLPIPKTYGGWYQGFCGGFSAHIEQRNYGHAARKATWLYAVRTHLPSLIWGHGLPPTAWISSDRPRSRLAGVKQLSNGSSSKTPDEFRNLLILIAGSVRNA